MTFYFQLKKSELSGVITSILWPLIASSSTKWLTELLQMNLTGIKNTYYSRFITL